jgi:hypothetical protein
MTMDEMSIPDDSSSKTNQVHHIEAFATNQSHPEIDPTDEKRITRKFDLHIIPWLFFMW